MALSLLSQLVCGCDLLPTRTNRRTDDVARVTKDTAAARNKTERGTQLLEKGHLLKAERVLTEAIAADADYGPAHNNLGRVYYQMDSLYRAAQAFEQASRLMPGRPEPHNNLGLIYERAGRLDEAAMYYATASTMEPDNPEFLGNLVRARIRLGHQDDDVRGMVSQLLILETRPDWIDWLGELLALGKFPSEAEESNTARNESDQGESDKGTGNQSDSDERSPVELLPPGNTPEPDGDDA